MSKMKKSRLMLALTALALPMLAIVPANGGTPKDKSKKDDVVYVCACLGTKSCSCMSEAKTEGPCSCGTEGGPPILLGAWRSARWIRLAAETCQGWIASGIFSKWEDVQAGLNTYRAAGGKRALLANIFTDLRAEPEPNPTAARAKISLYCPPAEARDRLQRLEQLGFDDALLVCPFDAPEQLETLRTLI